jgi:peptide/nickel transport system substrate-binding protein
VQVYYLGFNLQKAPVDDIRVRHAIQHAIDVPLLVEAILEGGATPATSVISPGVFGYVDMNLDELYPYDPEAAGALLDEAGWTMGSDGIRVNAEGERLVLDTLPANGRYLRDLAVAETVQEFLRQVGIELKLDVFEWATTFPLSQEDPLKYHLVTFAWLTTTTDADYTLYSNFRSDQFAPASWNKYRFADEEVDAWLAQARGSVDAAERADLYRLVQERLAEQLPSIPIYNTNELAVHRAGLGNFATHPVQYILDLFPVTLD